MDGRRGGDVVVAWCLGMSGGNDFDPSREWLGVAAVDLADPFRALGISPVDADAAAVTAAADRALARLQRFDPGPFRLAHEALQRRIDACRSEALAAIASRPEPGRHPAGAFAPPPPPLANRAAGPVFEIGADRTPAVSATPTPPPAPDVGPLTGPAPGHGLEEDFRLRRVVRRPRPSTGSGAGLFSLVALVVTGVFAYLFWPGSGPLATRTQRQVALVRRSGESRRPPVVESTPVATSPPVTSPPRRAQRPVPDQPAEPPRQPLPPTPDTPTAPPQPPPPPPPTPDPRVRLAAAVEKTLRQALAALRRGDFDTADEHVQTAAGIAEEDDALFDRVTGWRQLAVYARQFDGFRREAMKVATGDLDVGDQRISIVESTPTVFKYKAAGVLHRISPDAIPAPITTAVVRAWFAAEDQPGNHVILGTHLLLQDPPDVDGARREWATATQSGENLSTVEPLLSDPIVRAAARQ